VGTPQALDPDTLAEIIDQLGPVAVMTAIRDADGTITDFRYDFVNPAFCQTLGEPAEVLEGSGMIELYPSHTELGLFDAYRRVVETGEPFVSELPWFDERNVRAFLEVRATRFRDGFILTGRDVTAAKLAERVTQIFDSSDDAIISIDRDATITAWNAGAERLYGFSESETIGREFSLFAPDEAREDQLRQLRVALGPDASTVQFRTVRRHREGSLHAVEISASPIFTPSGDVAGASLIHRRIVDRPTASTADLVPGQEVEVWSGFTKRWVPGFWYESSNPDGSVRVRRGSDRTALADSVARSAVRPVRHTRLSGS
jgi:PAS domain S-box-containing protein